MLIFLKALLAILAIVGWLWSQKWLGQKIKKNSGQIDDLILDLTAPLNKYLNQNKKISDFLLISSSLIIDLLGLYLIFQGILGETIRPLISLLIVFSLRQLNQFFTSLPVPPGMIWHDPGVPSLLVTYKVSNDLFFSGHTALATLGMLELLQIGNPYLSLLAGLIFVYEVLVVIFLRAHWTMDIFTGAVVAALVFAGSDPLAVSLDSLLKSFL